MLLLVAAALAFALAVDGYEHAQHPLALLGAKGMPRAITFNLLGFVLPGALVAFVAWRLRARLDEASWLARVGAWTLLLSALSFAAQGLFPLDPADLDGRGSGLHASAWMGWWIAFATGALLLASGLRRGGAPAAGRRGVLAAASLAAALAVLFFVLLAPALLPGGAMQRLAFAAWFAWVLLAAHAADAPLSRGAVSSRG